MKILKLELMLAVLILAGPATAQLSPMAMRTPKGVMWTWVSGSSTLGATGVYGTKGVASASNYPAGRGSGCIAIDKASRLIWLFGGDNLASKNNLLNDFWRYNIATNQWTWISGSSSTMGTAVYGTKGVPSTANTPGYRKEAACWVDDSGYFWLYGGISTNTDNHNDLWRYNPTTNEWTWVSGANTSNAVAVYGIKGVPSASNVPPARERMAYWKGPNNTLWFFGGYDNNNGGRMNDLWRYDISSNQWTWMSGSTTVNDAGNYGTRGVGSINNYPRARRSTNGDGCVDSQGNFWLFGGDSYTTATLNHNDLWKYNPFTNEWTWVSGSSAPNPTGSFGTLFVPGTSNVPNARRLHSLLIGRGDEILVFHGYNLGEYNDFWTYNQRLDQWAWIGGSTTLNGAGSWGTMGVPSYSNNPGGRDAMMSVYDRDGTIWVFGGVTTKGYADLWKVWKN